MVGPVIRTFRQVKRGSVVKVTCDECGHSAKFIPSDITGYLGHDLTFKDARRLFRCDQCGKKNATVVALKPEPIRDWRQP